MAKDNCGPFRQSIALFQQQIADTRKELAAAEQDGINTGPIRNILRMQQQQLHAAIVALQNCEHPPPLTVPKPPAFIATLSGQVTLVTDNSMFSGPYSGPLNPPPVLVFSADHQSFSVTGLSFMFAGSTVTQVAPTSGVFDPSTGSLSLPIMFQANLPVVGMQMFDFQSPGLTTDQAARAGNYQPTGSRLDRSTYQITLVGTTSLTVFVVETIHAEVTIAGTLMPLP